MKGSRMKATITIKMDNAAFCNDDHGADGRELARILRRLADNVADDEQRCGDHRSLFDVNGNHVGEYIVSE